MSVALEYGIPTDTAGLQLRLGITRETMTKSIEHEMKGLHFDGEIDMRGLQQAIDLQVRLGAIKQPMRAQDIVDLRFRPTPLAPHVRAAVA